MKFFPRTNDLFDTVLDDMFTSPIFSTRNDMAMKTDITRKTASICWTWNCRAAGKRTSTWSSMTVI